MTVGLVTMVSMAMTGCSSTPDADYDGVCVDTTTQRRVDDGECDRNGGTGYSWRYYPRGSSIPAVGGSASGGVASVPDGMTGTRGGAPADGGTVSRGGFGHGGGHGVGG